MTDIARTVSKRNGAFRPVASVILVFANSSQANSNGQRAVGGVVVTATPGLVCPTARAFSSPVAACRIPYRSDRLLK